MGKRLNRSDYFIIYMIIISLACFIGGFFLGAGVMKSRSETAMEDFTKEITTKMNQQQLEKERKLYRVEDFVSFYYNVLVPLEKFKTAHFTYLDRLSASPKEIRSLSSEALDSADETIKKIEQVNVSSTSPLLKQSLQEYLQSLQAYMDGMNQILDGDTTEMTVQTITHQQNLESYKQKWLRAQADFYKAIAFWEEMYVTNKPLVKQISQNNISIEQWKSYPFHLRDYIAAEHLYRSNDMERFNPEDLTSRIDAVVNAGQAKSLGWKDIPFALQVLSATDAVRPGDFKSLRNRLYPSIKSPELLFFTE